MKRLLRVLGLCFMLLLYLGIVAPLADAWCVYNYSDLPLRIWSGPGTTDAKFYVDNGKFNCCTEKYQTEEKRNKKHPGKLVGPCTGPAHITLAEAYTPLEESLYYVDYEVPANGAVIIKGNKTVSLMTYEVYGPADMTTPLKTGSVLAAPGNEPYKP